MSDHSHNTRPLNTELSLELQALIAGLGGRTPQAGTVLDWAALCQIALAHGVAPLLHQNWAAFPDELPAAVLSDLGELRRQSRKQGLLGLHQRDEMLRILDEAGIPSLVLKGGAWARHWYTDISLRPFNDIDLLVQVDDIPRARAALLNAGYEETGILPAPHHDMPLQHPHRPLGVELHRWVLALPASQKMEFDDVFDRSIALGGRDALVRTLGQEDTLVHLCMHLLQHMESEPGWRLLNVWDIIRHIASNPIQWDVFDARAHELGVAPACRAALGLVNALTGAVLPERYCDSEAGHHLVGFPFMRYSLTPVRHRGVLSLLEVLSRDHWLQSVPASIGNSLRRRARSRQHGVANEGTSREGNGSSPLLYLPQELWWLIRETAGLKKGRIHQGIRQIRWEQEARHTVYDLLRRAVDSGHEPERMDSAIAGSEYAR